MCVAAGVVAQSTSSVWSHNNAGERGGVVEVRHVGVGPPAVFTAVNSTFAHNTAVGRGGVVFADSSVAGAGSALFGCVVNFTACNVEGNAAPGGGINDGIGRGGAFSVGAIASIFLRDTDVLRNQARAGGGIEAFGRLACSVEVEGGQVSHNTAADGGAIVVAGAANLHARGIYASGNTGTRYGIRHERCCTFVQRATRLTRGCVLCEFSRGR